MNIGCIYVPVPGWELLLLREPLATAVVAHQAERVQQSIFSKLPTGHGGSYAGNFEGGSSITPTVADTGTAAAKMTLGDPRWHIIEFGNAKYGGVHNPPYAPIRRGVDSSGLRWVAE